MEAAMYSDYKSALPYPSPTRPRDSLGCWWHWPSWEGPEAKKKKARGPGRRGLVGGEGFPMKYA